MLTLLRKEKVAPKATNEMKFLQPQAGFMVFSTNEVRFKGVRARPVGGAGAHAPETSSPRATRGFTVFLTCRSPPIRFYLILHLSLFLMLIEKK